MDEPVVDVVLHLSGDSPFLAMLGGRRVLIAPSSVASEDLADVVASAVAGPAVGAADVLADAELPPGTVWQPPGRPSRKAEAAEPQDPTKWPHPGRPTRVPEVDVDRMLAAGVDNQMWVVSDAVNVVVPPTLGFDIQ